MNRFLSSVVSWLRAGYPDGIPPTDSFAVLALLTRRLSNDEVMVVAHELMRRGDFDDVDIGVLITQITDDLPSPDDVERVRERLAAKGWPFDDARDGEGSRIAVLRALAVPPGSAAASLLPALERVLDGRDPALVAGRRLTTTTRWRAPAGWRGHRRRRGPGGDDVGDHGRARRAPC